MATINITGTILDQFADPVVGMTVALKEFVGISFVQRDSDVTNASGQYSLSYTYTSFGDFFRCDPTALAPHYADPGQGPNHAVGGDFVEDFTSTFSNTNPTCEQIANREYVEDSGPQVADFNISDADGDVRTPVKLTGEAWGTVSKPGASTGRWTFDIDGVTPGDYDFTYRAEDEYGAVSATRSVTVTVVSGNEPPDLVAPSNKSYANKSGNQTFQLVATDPESDPITYSKQSGPSWVTVSLTGLVTVKTNDATRGVHSVTYRASATGGTDDESHTITITNNAPVLTNPGNQTYTTDTGEQTLQLVATDADGDTKTYSKTAGQSWGTVHSTTGLVTFDTDGVAAGTYGFTFRVSDGTATDSESFNVVIKEPVPAPFFQMQG